MFSVGHLYSTHDFLKFLKDSEVSPENFKISFNKFKYSYPEKILDLSFKCGWILMDRIGNIKLSNNGLNIAKLNYKEALFSQLCDMINVYNPTWASVIPKGREESKHFLPPEVYQCFYEAGLFGTFDDSLIQMWDSLALAYRNFNQKKLLDIGRKGEKLSFDYERQRTKINPIWQSLESNISGFDILSVVSEREEEKLRIEVKSTESKLDYAHLYITQNEWDTALSSKHYIFHLWLLNPSPKLFIIEKEIVEVHIPRNNNEGCWKNVMIPFKSLITV